MRAIALHHLSRGVPPAGATATVRALSDAMDRLGIAPEAEVALVLGDDDLLRNLNSTYRGIDAPTDVLSFASEPGDVPPGHPPYLGDIIISVPQAAANAAAAGSALRPELSRLAVHGLLHLLGHEDDTEEGVEAMARLVDKLYEPPDEPAPTGRDDVGSGSGTDSRPSTERPSPTRAPRG